MKMNKAVFFLLFLTLVFAGGCSQTKPSPNTPSRAVLPKVSFTHAVTPSPKFSKASASPTKSLTFTTKIPTTTSSQVWTPTPPPPPATSTHPAIPTSTSTQTSLPWMMNEQCPEILETPPPNYVLSGTLVLQTDWNLDAFLYQPRKTVHFPHQEGERLYEFKVSPDRSHVLYEHASKDFSTDFLVIATAHGQSVWSRNISNNRSIWIWIDNEHLLSFMVLEKDALPQEILVNPFSGDEQEIIPDFPNFAVRELSDIEWSGGVPKYDPSMTRAVYPECDLECSDKLIRGEPGWPVVLWDIEKKQVLTRLVTMDWFGYTPIWSSDGTQFIMATHFLASMQYANVKDFYTVSRDGQVKQLTHFVDNYPDMAIYDNYSLSPDGHYLAFWMVAPQGPYDDTRLAVLDTKTGHVTNTCIRGYPFMNNAYGPDSVAAPIWSPDNTQVVIVSRDPQDMSQRFVVLVDIEKGFAARILKDVAPAGWMVGP
jgi:hypothetical protein